MFTVLALAAALAGTLYFVGNRPLTVQTAVVENNVHIRVFGLGTVEAQVIASIGFEVGATLTELTADHGSMVKSGEVLARLESSEQQARVARASAGVQTAEAVLERTASLIARQAAILEQKEEANRRQQGLLKRGVAAIEKAEESAKDLTVSQADYALAVADAAVARAATATARADLAYETALLDHHVLNAPFDAMIVERRQELGSVVKAGDPVYTLVNPDSIWALAYIEEARSGGIAPGQEAEIRLRSLPGQSFKGRVVRIGIESDRVSEERRVWVKCTQCPADFHLGEQAEVIVTIAVLPTALLVPENMVTGYDGSAGTIWITESGKARQATVTLGQRTLDGRIAVTGGVPRESQIITGPLVGLKQGRQVQIAAESVP